MAGYSRAHRTIDSVAADARKITSALGSKLGEEDDDRVLDVIVELTPDPAEASTAPALREAFEKAVQPVSEAISGYGGEVVDAAWINRTVHAKLPATKVAELTGLPEVAALDVPHRLEPE